MKKYTKWIILSFMLLGFSGIASAQGLYLALGAYGSQGKDEPFDHPELAGGASLGFMFNKHVGVELSYYDLGELEDQLGLSKLETSAPGAALMFVAPMKVVKLYAKLGAARIESKIRTGLSTIVDTESTEPYGGIGIEFGFKHVGVFLEAMYFPNDVNDIAILGGGLRIWLTK